MASLRILGSLFIIATYLEGTARGQFEDYPYFNTSLPWEERVDDLVSRLTLEEMTDQMMNGGRVTHAPAIPRLGVPPYGWGAECLHGAGQAGPATSFPQAIGLSAIFDASMHYELAVAIGLEVRSKHNNFSAHGNYGEHTSASCWSPVINIMRDPRWGRNQETYGEDPYMTGVLAQAFVKGIQGDHPRYVMANGGCKHFAAYSGPENIPEIRFQFNAIVSERDLRMTYYPAFQRCVEAGTYSLMCSYHRINGVPACASDVLLTDVLRKEWGFTGYVISDEFAIEAIRLNHNYTSSPQETCQKAIRAGCNLEDGPPIIPPDYRFITDTVNQGMLDIEEVREAIKPLFYTRMRLGQFDPVEMNPFATLDPDDYVQSAAHQNLSLFAAMRSFVLMKNANDFLPLPPGTKFQKLAIVGPFSDNIGGIFGNYAPDPDPRYVVTPLQGLGVLGEEVEYSPGCFQSNPLCLNYNSEAVISAVSGANFVIACLGTGRIVEAEQNDRANINLPGQQLQLLQDAVEHSGDAPVVVLLFNGGPLEISWAQQNPRVVAIIECFFPGQTTGEALRRVLLNEGPSSNPAGRLPNTWPTSLTNYPPMVNYSMQGRTYRYYTTLPAYPFGYGLSYTRYRYTALRLSPSIITSPSDVIDVEVDLINEGSRDGEEVVQIYVSWNNVTLPVPRLQLVGFNRYKINAQQTITATFQIVPDKHLLVWDDDSRKLVAVTGSYFVYAGGQQPGQITSAPSNVLLASFTFTSPSAKRGVKLHQ